MICMAETGPQTNWQTNKDGNNKGEGREVICINIYIRLTGEITDLSSNSVLFQYFQFADKL